MLEYFAAQERQKKWRIQLKNRKSYIKPHLKNKRGLIERGHNRRFYDDQHFSRIVKTGRIDVWLIAIDFSLVSKGSEASPPGYGNTSSSPNLMHK